MKRRNFVRHSALLPFAAATIQTSTPFQESKQEVYELRVYELTWGWKKKLLMEYFEKALIPALNRLGAATVGVFEEYGKSDPPKVYVLIPFSSFESYTAYLVKLNKDENYLEQKKSFDQIEQAQKVYDRYSSDLMLAFSGIPKLILPTTQERIFELRTYEGYNEDAVRRKVKMFNEGELDIFKRVSLNSVFFGEALVGKNLPKLTYLLTFKNMEERDRNWEKFIDDPAWKKISKEPQYANTVSHIDKVFLTPHSISQI